MHSILQQTATQHSAESLAAQLTAEPGLVLLESAMTGGPYGRYSFVAVRPFLVFRSFGDRCEITVPRVASETTAENLDRALVVAGLAPRDGSATGGLRGAWAELFSCGPGRMTDGEQRVLHGNPWTVLGQLVERYTRPDETDLPFPAGGCFGFWGYDLKDFVEPKLRPRAVKDLGLPDCHLQFCDSVVVFDHLSSRVWVCATGLAPDGSRTRSRAERQAEFWQRCLDRPPCTAEAQVPLRSHAAFPVSRLASTLTAEEFVRRVQRIQEYIRAGDLYQACLSHRLTAPLQHSAWALYESLRAASPAPFAAYLDGGEFQLVSSSPELFLRLSGLRIVTRPIKGTRPRAADADTDARRAWELQTSPKEHAELLMITDLMRNDLGRVCEFGSVRTPDLMRLESYAHVHHLVSTVEGRLRSDVTHLDALAACFPGGSITGAPKFRAMEIIDELEPTARGPFTGALGYIGFNLESQLSMIIRTAICQRDTAYFPVGAGIVADSQPDAEYEETLAKAGGLMAALAHLESQPRAGFASSATVLPRQIPKSS